MARQSGSMSRCRQGGRDVPESGRIMLTLSFVEFDPQRSPQSGSLSEMVAGPYLRMLFTVPPPELPRS